MKIKVIHGSIIDLTVDAVVNPANSTGRMGGGVAKAIKLAGGRQIEQEAMSQAPIRIGEAILTGGGDLLCRFVIHAPTMVKPVERTTIENVSKATRAALRRADQKRLKSVAFPGMGTGAGKLSKIEAARAMVDEIRRFPAVNLKEIVLVDTDTEMVHAFEEALRNPDL